MPVASAMWYKTMKRIKELTFLTLVLMFVTAFFAEYAVTASAPSIREELAPIPGEPAQKSARGSFLEQLIKSTPMIFRSSAPAAVAAAPVAVANESLIVEHAKLDAPPVATSPETPEPSATPTLADSTSPVTATAVLPAKGKPDANYCDSSYVGGPLSFTQTSQL